MKYLPKHCSSQAKKSQQIFSALVLTSLLSLGTSLTRMDSATAAVTSSPSSGSSLQGKSELISQNSDRLPGSLASIVRRDLSDKVGIPAGQLRIIESSRQSWPDGCLGLGGPAESCLFAIVEGWRIVLSDGTNTWVYRTDSEGQSIRLEPQTTPSEP